MTPWECGGEGAPGATALSPPARGGLHDPMTGVRPAGHFLPALGSVFARGRGAAFSAVGGSLGPRGPWLLISVCVLPWIVPQRSFFCRFSRIFIVTSIGDPAKPNSSRIRRSMKRR